jgi:methylenetetrahydrofolate--tRNA-(uracil-5-)-methyltransferase
MLQQELHTLQSFLIHCAEKTAVPAGGALAVDREAFGQMVTEAITTHPRIRLIREEMPRIPVDTPTIIASGPLTSLALSDDIARLCGQEYLYFYDALSPIVEASSIDMSIAFTASRYQRGEADEGDYINCPLNKEEYLQLVAALRSAETIELRDFEREDPHFFEGCLPVEQIARRGDDALAFGPMRPVGLRDPRTGKRPHAVVQLRQDNLAGTLYNLVGFQTNIRWAQQKDILRLIPGLQNAQFVRMGQMHRNTFINAPVLLHPTLQFRGRDDLYFAGQITGIEGYAGNIATGLVAAVNLARYLSGQSAWVLPPETMLGALCHYVAHAAEKHFQPMKANFGILPEPPPGTDKHGRKPAQMERARLALQHSLQQLADARLQQPIF